MTNVVLAATGHVGAAVVAALRAADAPVLAVVRDPARAEPLRQQGAEVAVADVNDTAALHALFRRGTRAFLLNPPADVSGDTDVEEHRTIRAITAALPDSGLEKLVVASTYGAQPGDAIGDLSVLYDFEQLVLATGIPAAINRGAYYYVNLDPLLAPARQGTLPTMFPANLAIPMVSPTDLGRAAARRLLSSPRDVGIHHVEGPRRYSFADVAAAFAVALGHPVSVATIPRDRWEATFRDRGFSVPAARAFARMTAVSVDGFEMPADPERGTVTLAQHIGALVAAA